MNSLNLSAAAPFYDRNPPVGSGAWDGIWFEMVENVFIGGTPFLNTLNFRRGTHTAAKQFTLHHFESNYTIFTGQMGRVDGTRMDDVTVNFLGDGAVLHTAKLKASDKLSSFFIPVAAVRLLKIEITFPLSGWRSGLGSNATRYAIAGFLQ